MRALLVAAAVVVADQVTKALVRRVMVLNGSIAVIPRVLNLTYVRNTGAAFGIMPQKQWLFVAATLLVISLIAIALVSGRPHGRVAESALGLALGGSIGNLIDRLATGRVTDFLDLRVWPVFNLADSAIVVGAFLLVAAIVWHPEHSPHAARQTD